MPVVLDAQRISRSLARIAHEILERNHQVDELALIGIRRRGVPLARRLAQNIQNYSQTAVPVGALDIFPYRDDVQHDVPPKVTRTEIPFSIVGKSVIVVDDVLYTGRSIRAAMDGIIDLGRPQSIQLIVLIDRGHRELPIRADYVGKAIETAKNQVLKLHLKETDKVDQLVLI